MGNCNVRGMKAACAAVVMATCLTAAAHGQHESYSLMIQMSPTDAGAVSPAVGIHRIRVGDPVTLQAVAKPGYRFLYWLGDVSDGSTSQSVVVINAPKIVIAVFGRLEYEPAAGGGGSGAARYVAERAEGIEGNTEVPGGGAGASVLTAGADYVGGGRAVSSGRPPSSGRTATKLRTVPSSGGTGGGTSGGNGGGTGGSGIFVPGGNGAGGNGGSGGNEGGNGEPIPEPATVALLGLGALLFVRPRLR